MASLNTQQVGIAGITPAYVAASGGGDEFSADDHTFIHVKNGGGSSINVTLPTPGTAFGEQIADAIIAVPAGAERMIGPFPYAGFVQADGLVTVQYSAVTTVTVAVLRC